MKVKSLLVGMLAVAALASCSKEENLGVTDGQSNVYFKLESSSSRAIEDAVAGATPVFDNITYTLLGSDGATYGTGTKTAAEAKTGFVIEGVNSRATKIQVVTDGSIQGETVADYQGKGAIVNVQLSGESNFTESTGDLGGKTYQKTADVTLKANVARLEVAGKINLPVDSKYTSVVIKGVYTNFYYSDKACTAWVDSKTVDADYKTSVDDRDLNGIPAGKCSARQLFPATITPHIIVKVEQTDKKTGAKTDGFFTLSIDKLAALEGGKIYKMDVTDLLSGKYTDILEPTDPDPTDPTPEATTFNLKVSVTVVDWTAENVTPTL